MTTAARSGPDVVLGDVDLGSLSWVAEDATIAELARTMEVAGTSAVLVGADGAIATERDIVQAVAYGRSVEEPAIKIATPDAVCAPVTDTVAEAFVTMVARGIRHLVVVDTEGTAVGIVSTTRIAALVFGDADVPSWLSALRTALGVEAIAW